MEEMLKKSLQTEGKTIPDRKLNLYKEMENTGNGISENGFLVFNCSKI